MIDGNAPDQYESQDVLEVIEVKPTLDACLNAIVMIRKWHEDEPRFQKALDDIETHINKMSSQLLLVYETRSLLRVELEDVKSQLVAAIEAQKPPAKTPKTPANDQASGKTS